MRKKIFNNEKLNKYTPHFLIIGITALSIYPVGCFAWGPPFSQPSTPSVTISEPPLPEFLEVNPQEALKAFKCVADKTEADQKDRELSFSEVLRIEADIKNNAETVEVSRPMYEGLKAKHPDCSFP